MQKMRIAGKSYMAATLGMGVRTPVVRAHNLHFEDVLRLAFGKETSC